MYLLLYFTALYCLFINLYNLKIPTRLLVINESFISFPLFSSLCNKKIILSSPMHDRKQNKENKKQQKIAKLFAKQARKINEPKREKLSYTSQLTIPETLPGTLKDLSTCPDSYDPAYVECGWYTWWQAKGVFRPAESGESFVIPIPPPNITGSLHIGHAMMAALQDTLVRYKRLCGYSTLYIPGTDHAGIATQSVVERKIYAETKLTRDDIGREEFLKSIKEWKNLYGNKIVDQLKRMGSSLDFDRERFTLDDEYTESVIEAFNRFYEAGIIYREMKMVNWCGKAKTTLSDLEVVNEEIKGGSEILVDDKKYKIGVLYRFRYPIIGFLEKNEPQPLVKLRDSHVPGDLYEEEKIYTDVFYGDMNTMGYVTVCTTRPETILGDSALCFNPSDKRFNLKNCKAINPITRAVIPIIFDDRCDINFGTGVLKVTPNHDFIDFEIGRKHNLNGITILSYDNTIKVKDIEITKLKKEFVEVINIVPHQETNAPKHKGYLKETLSFLKSIDGMNRFEARELIIDNLKGQGLYEFEEDYDIVLPICSRTGDIIEPMVRKQWWMKCSDLGRRAVDAVRNEEIMLHPPESKKVWYNWLENIKDWCLSRQLWWGHRVPAWRVFVNGFRKGWAVARSIKDLKVKIIYDHLKHNAKKDQEYVFKIEEDTINELERSDGKVRFIYENNEYLALQDEDVLDTWFSSGLWPFAILGWPKNTDDMNKYFPSSILETGSDILFFWVARMVMMSIGLTGKIPFKQILLHGIVRDAHGKKMSKSLGNIIDPLYIIEGISLKDLIDSVQIENKKERERAIIAQKTDFPRGIPCCGTDALRFTLCTYSNGIKDVNLDVLRVEGYRRMCNKLWNAFRFVYKLIDDEKTDIEDDITKMNLDFLDVKNITENDPDTNEVSNKEISQNLNSPSNLNNLGNSGDLDNSSSSPGLINSNSRMNNLKKPGSPKPTHSTENMAIDSTIETMSNPSGNDVLTKLIEQKKAAAEAIKMKEMQEKNESELHDLVAFKLSNLFIKENNHHLLWILRRRNETIEAIHSNLHSFNFMAATQSIHKFFLHDFCDVFIEIVKRRKANSDLKILFVVFVDIIKLFHPFMPYITEEIFQRLRMGRKNIPISFTFFPKIIEISDSLLFEEILSIGKSIRSIIDSNKIKKPRVEILEGENSKTLLYYLKLLVRSADRVEIEDRLECVFIDETKNFRFGVCEREEDGGSV